MTCEYSHSKSTKNPKNDVDDINDLSNDQLILAEQISFVLSRWIECHHSLQKQPLEGINQLFLQFEGLYISSISLKSYIYRIELYGGCTRPFLILTLVLLDKIVKKYPIIGITQNNIHRLFLACVVVSIKMYSDYFYTNNYYAKVGGISVQELNHLEISLLILLQYDLYVTPETYEQYDKVIHNIRFRYYTDQNVEVFKNC